MDREHLDRWCERAILGVVLAILVYLPLAMGGVRPADFMVAQALTLVAIGLWVARFWVNPSHRLQWTPICWAVVAFVIYALIRYHQADLEYVARQELIRVLVYAWLFFIVLNNLHRQETTQLFIYGILGIGTYLALYGIYQFIKEPQTLWCLPNWAEPKSAWSWTYLKPPQYRGRGSGTFICPDHLAGTLELLMPAAMARLFLGRSGYVTRVLFGYVSLVLLAGIAATVSRGGWLATGLALLVCFGFLLRYRAYRRWVLLALLVLAVGMYAFVAHARHVNRRFSLAFVPGQLENVMIRPLLWQAAIDVWEESPWLGVGPGHFDHRFPMHRPPAVQLRAVWAHNDYLNALADWGVIGVGIIGAALICLGAGVIKTWRFVHRAHNDLVAKRSDRAAHVLGVAIGLLALLFHSFVDFNMQLPANAILAIALMASLTSHLRFATDNYWVTPHLLGRVLVTVLGLVAVVYLGDQLCRRYQEQRFIQQGAHAASYPERAAALKAAFAIEPQNADTPFMIGEAYRWQMINDINQSEDSTGQGAYRQFALEAMSWYQVALQLNPYEPEDYVRYGMCLDWLGRHAQADVFFKQSLRLDPNNYYLIALTGWHEMQQGNYAKAKEWFEKSLKLKWWENRISESYLPLAVKRLNEQGGK